MNDKLTRNDIRKMEEEIEHRKLVVRKEALEAVKEARAQGDLSENFEYYAAKKYKNQNESRIRYLERMIRTAQIIEDDAREDEIGLNKTVEVEFVEDGTIETYRMVTTVRNNPLQGLISIDSPIGKALAGHRCGDTVHVQVNSDFGYDVVVRSVENTPDDDSIALRKF
ncbi:MAG: transcription elongation factor GreA [Lachnospiraceae bacterium]|mgnify:FL=1|nr:transcription elongation factor GreA [Lachnospiraceae bacterium]MCI8967859.1 transcription elongation factor GreA [Lachnospiraceae bacterium]